MAGWGLAAAGSHIDGVARVLAVAGLAVAFGSAVLTWYLWRRSGPAIVVLVRTEEQKERPVVRDRFVGVEVVNSGRMPAVIREVRVRYWEGGIWAGLRELALEPTYGGFPVEVPPTGFIGAELPEAEQMLPPGIIQGIAVRGDGRIYRSTNVRLR